MTRPLLALALGLAFTGCGEGAELAARSRPRTLAPYPNPFGPSDPLYSPQPRRERPTVIAADARRAYVALTGTEDEPGEHVALLDHATGATERVRVGLGPSALALHPGGEMLVANARFGDRLSVVDLASRRTREIPVDFYATALAFSPDGRELWLANRWRDSVGLLEVSPDTLEVTSRHEHILAAPTNPRELVISPDGTLVAVGGPTALEVLLIDRASRTPKATVDLGAPVNGLAFAGPFLVVATTSRSTHHLPHDGPDTDGDGLPGDGTPNVNFQDLQNELAVIDTRSGVEVHRYTSDTICCRDFRDVHPADLARGGDLLPPRSHWIVGGALPEQLVVRRVGDGYELWVSYAASNELGRFTLDPRDGSLAAGPTVASGGHNPFGLALTADSIFVVNRLSDAVTALELDTMTPRWTRSLALPGAPVYPATDAEIGELFNFATAPFSVDGDQSCGHCHRDNGNIAKAFSMPLTEHQGVGLRMTMAYRGAADTRPWFFESAMDESNFKPVTNEFARIENFCCSDYTLWPGGAPRDCASAPPDTCLGAKSPGSLDGFDPSRDPEAMRFAHARPTAYMTRDAFFSSVAERLFGRTTSFGDSLYFEDLLTGERRPIALNFDGLTRALGLFLLTRPRLLPNPNAPDTSAALRGKALFESPQTACANCHPAPTFTVSTTNNPAGLPLRFAPVVSPLRNAEGDNLDLLTLGFMATFPSAHTETCEEVCGPELCSADESACDHLRHIHLGAPSLRGIWDRPPRFLHDGRAHSLREVLCTPGHPALAPGERGYNERDGIPDTHGGTSHLSPRDIDDLITYLETL